MLTESEGVHIDKKSNPEQAGLDFFNRIWLEKRYKQLFSSISSISCGAIRLIGRKGAGSFV